MKNAAILIISLLTLTLFGCSSGGNDPLAFERLTIVTGEQVSAIHFINGDDGFAATNTGNIYRTSDGGKSFTQAGTSGGRALADVYFLDDEVGFACGVRGTLLRSSDGGASWLPVSADTNLDLVGIGFSNEDLGFIAANLNNGENSGKGVIGRSTDQGNSWNFSGTEYRDLEHVDVVPQDHIWILAKESLLYTTNSGQSWDQAANGAPGINALVFKDVQHGWQVGDVGLIRYSSDGGWSWQNKLKMTDQSLHSVVVPLPDRIYVAGENFVALSTNHGRNWVMDAVSHKIDFVDMQFAKHVVFAAGRNGELIKFKY